MDCVQGPINVKQRGKVAVRTGVDRPFPPIIQQIEKQVGHEECPAAVEIAAKK